MPCYSAPPTRSDLRNWHESDAKRIIQKLTGQPVAGPTAVRDLCNWCKHHSLKEIDEAGAKYWWQNHQRYDLRKQAMGKLTPEEMKALDLTEGDYVG